MYTKRKDAFDNLINEMFNFNTAPFTYSRSAVREIENGLAVDLLLPGFLKDEVNISVDGNELVIEAKTERTLPRFLNSHVKKTYAIDNLQDDSIKATLENGILTVSFSTAEKTVARKISVE